jgi:hypothetical protein
VQEEFDKAIEEGRRILTGPEKWRAQEAKRRERLKERKADAEVTKALASALRVGVRYARMLRSEGTTDPKTARLMADILGTATRDHLRERSRTGRQVDLPAWFMRLWVPRGSFRDFLADPGDLSEQAEKLAAFLRQQTADAQIQQIDIDSLEKLMQHCRLFLQNGQAEGSSEIWKAFKLWKIELVAALAARTVQEDLLTDKSLHRQYWRGQRS